MKTFVAVIRHNPENGGAWVELPFDAKDEFASLRPKVKAVFDNTVEYRGSLVRMGGDCHILGVRKDIRAKLNKHPGDEVEVQLELDTQPRKVEVPEILAATFKAKPAVQKYFDQLSFTHRGEYVNYITEAKKEETRLRRVQKVIAMMEKDLSK